MDASPMHVGAHLRANPLTFAFFKSFPAAHVIRLITSPGMATEANICHRNMSPALIVAARKPPPKSSCF